MGRCREGEGNGVRHCPLSSSVDGNVGYFIIIHEIEKFQFLFRNVGHIRSHLEPATLRCYVAPANLGNPLIHLIPLMRGEYIWTCYTDCQNMRRYRPDVACMRDCRCTSMITRWGVRVPGQKVTKRILCLMDKR